MSGLNTPPIPAPSTTTSSPNPTVNAPVAQPPNSTGPISLADQFKSILEPNASPASPHTAALSTEPAVNGPSTETTPVAGEELTSASPDPELDEDIDFEKSTAAIDPQSTRGQKLWQEHQFYRQLTQAPDKGGIGHEPTVEDIRSYYGSHAIQQLILRDVHAGNGEAFLTNFAQLQPQGFAEIIRAVPKFLTEGAGGTDPQLAEFFEPVRQEIAKTTTEGMRDAYLNEARKQTDPARQKYWFDRAQMIAHDWLEQELAPTDLEIKVDPLAADKKRIADGEKRIAEHNRQVAESAYSGFQNTTQDAVLPEIEKHAKSLLAPFQASPAFNRASVDLMRQTIDVIEKSPQAMGEINALWAQARRAFATTNGNVNPQWAKAHSNAVQQCILKYAKPIAHNLRIGVAKEFGLLRGAGNGTKVPEPVRAPGTNLAPAVTAQPVERQKGEDFRDYAARKLTGVLQTRIN